MERSRCKLARMSHRLNAASCIDFPQEPVLVRADERVDVSMWRVVSDKSVWYEWCLTSPRPTPIHNPRGRSYTIGLWTSAKLPSLTQFIVTQVWQVSSPVNKRTFHKYQEFVFVQHFDDFHCIYIIQKHWQSYVPRSPYKINVLLYRKLQTERSLLG